MRTRRSNRLVALTVLVMIAGIGCKSEDKKQAEKPPPSKDRGLLDRGKALGNRAKNAAVNAGSKGVDLGKSILDKGTSWGSVSVDETRKLGKKIVDEAGSNTVAAGSKINQLLSSIARDPDKRVSTADRVGRMIILMIPLVGPTKRYADARKLYEAGVKAKDQAKIERARREVLIAFVEAGLDVGMLGIVGSRLDLIASGADKVLSALKISRSVSVLAGESLDTFDGFVDALLTYDDIRRAVDAALNTDFGG